ncbi:MAG: hypothetical protein J7L23_01745 [Candidatus Diapherotrites archaeon]|nr:hypothetical protein [Candidatus Diapherotrites archaeon]
MVLERKWEPLGNYRLADKRIVSLHRREESFKTKKQVYYEFRDEKGKTCSQLGFEVMGNMASIHTRAKTKKEFSNKKLFESLLKVSLKELKKEGVQGVITIFFPSVGKEDFARRALEKHGFKLKNRSVALDYGDAGLQEVDVPYYVITDLQKIHIGDIPLERVEG